MIAELTAAFRAARSSPQVRAVVLAAEGKSFCAGADLNWMREAAGYTLEENVQDARRLAVMLRSLYECPKPVVARVQGAVYGGGVGLAAACDFVAALETATFCFSEVRLGLVPAVISPFVLRKMSPGEARRYFVTAERFGAAEARRLGLVSETAASIEDLDRLVARTVEGLLLNGPEAMAACKQLVDEVCPFPWQELANLTSRQIAERRASAEGQEGLRAFFEKRPPDWAGPLLTQTDTDETDERSGE